jgi:glycosyltransferase involved in cell wall biosynthesis
MRVVHISSSFPRSVDDPTAPFLLDLLRRQRDAGWEVSVVTTHDAGLPRRQLIDGIPVRRVRYAPGHWEVLAYRGGGHGGLRSPWHALLLPGLVIGMAIALVGEVRRLRPDVIHAHWLLPSGMVAVAIPRRKARVVITLHGSDIALVANPVARQVGRLVARRADAVLAVSESLAGQAATLLGLGPDRIAVGRISLPDHLRPTALPGGERRLLAAGRASAEKGFDVLLRALARPEAGDWRLTLVTAGPEAANLARLAEPLGDRVTIQPLLPQQELMNLVAQHHAVVVPSRREGLGMFALEAIALGRPVIASTVGGLPEVVTDGADGVLVTPDDPAALAAALSRFTPHLPRGTAVERHRGAAVLAAHAACYRATTPAGSSS